MRVVECANSHVVDERQTKTTTLNSPIRKQLVQQSLVTAYEYKAKGSDCSVVVIYV